VKAHLFVRSRGASMMREMMNSRSDDVVSVFASMFSAILFELMTFSPLLAVALMVRS
jgi:hypothetical protein